MSHSQTVATPSWTAVSSAGSTSIASNFTMSPSHHFQLYSGSDYLTSHMNSLIGNTTSNPFNKLIYQEKQDEDFFQQSDSELYDNVQDDQQYVPPSPVYSACSSDSLEDNDSISKIHGAVVRRSSLKKPDSPVRHHRKVTFSDSIEFDDGRTWPLFENIQATVPFYKRNNMTINSHSHAISSTSVTISTITPSHLWPQSSTATLISRNLKQNNVQPAPGATILPTPFFKTFEPPLPATPSTEDVLDKLREEVLLPNNSHVNKVDANCNNVSINIAVVSPLVSYCNNREQSYIENYHVGSVAKSSNPSTISSNYQCLDKPSVYELAINHQSEKRSEPFSNNYENTHSMRDSLDVTQITDRLSKCNPFEKGDIETYANVHSTVSFENSITFDGAAHDIQDHKQNNDHAITPRGRSFECTPNTTYLTANMSELCDTINNETGCANLSSNSSKTSLINDPCSIGDINSTYTTSNSNVNTQMPLSSTETLSIPIISTVQSSISSITTSSPLMYMKTLYRPSLLKYSNSVPGQIHMATNIESTGFKQTGSNENVMNHEKSVKSCGQFDMILNRSKIEGTIEFGRQQNYINSSSIKDFCSTKQFCPISTTGNSEPLKENLQLGKTVPSLNSDFTDSRYSPAPVKSLRSLDKEVNDSSLFSFYKISTPNVVQQSRSQTYVGNVANSCVTNTTNAYLHCTNSFSQAQNRKQLPVKNLSQSSSTDEIYDNVQRTMANLKFEIKDCGNAEEHLTGYSEMITKRPNISLQEEIDCENYYSSSITSPQSDSKLLTAIQNGTSIPIRVHHMRNNGRRRIVVSADTNRHRGLKPHPPTNPKCSLKVAKQQDSNNNNDRKDSVNHKPPRPRANSDSRIVAKQAQIQNMHHKYRLRKASFDNWNQGDSMHKVNQGQFISNRSAYAAASPVERTQRYVTMNTVYYQWHEHIGLQNVLYTGCPMSDRNLQKHPFSNKGHVKQAGNDSNKNLPCIDKVIMHNDGSIAQHSKLGSSVCSSSVDQFASNRCNEYVPLGKTPTDEEIDKLWANVRESLSTDVPDQAYSDSVCVSRTPKDKIRKSRIHSALVRSKMGGSNPSLSSKSSPPTLPFRRYGSHETLNRYDSNDSVSSTNNCNQRQAVLPQRASKAIRGSWVKSSQNNPRLSAKGPLVAKPKCKGKSMLMIDLIV